VRTENLIDYLVGNRKPCGMGLKADVPIPKPMAALATKRLTARMHPYSQERCIS